MTATLRNVFADTGFWVGLIVRQDQHHRLAQAWASRITGRIITTVAVLLETANAFSRPSWRGHSVALFDRLRERSDVEVVPLSPALWQRAWDLYRNRPDKSWSLTDCVSFEVMQDADLKDALTADDHFRQAGFRAVLLEQP